jgi:hypothetical protein
MKYFLLLLLSLLSIGAQAIPVLTQTTFYPSVGQMATGYSADTLSNPGPAGAGVSWTFNNSDSHTCIWR